MCFSNLILIFDLMILVFGKTLRAKGSRAFGAGSSETDCPYKVRLPKIVSVVLRAISLLFGRVANSAEKTKWAMK